MPLSGHSVNTLSALLLGIILLALDDSVVLLVPSLASLLPLLLVYLPLELACQVVLGDRRSHLVREFLKQVKLHLEGSVHTDLISLVVLHPVREGMSATQVARMQGGNISAT